MTRNTTFILAALVVLALSFINFEFAGIACVGLLIGAVTEAQYVRSTDSTRIGGGGVAAGVVLYTKTLVFIDAATGMYTNTSNSGANQFAGISRDDYDNSGGADGDIKCEFDRDGEFELTGAGFTAVDVGKPAYADENFGDLGIASASKSRIGTITQFTSATQVFVLLDEQAA